LQKDVGHYGIFSGRRYKEEILPLIVKFVKKHSVD
jgi:poly-beta-hydroxyalkanoate depolymerase